MDEEREIQARNRLKDGQFLLRMRRRERRQRGVRSPRLTLPPMDRWVVSLDPAKLSHAGMLRRSALPHCRRWSRCSDRYGSEGCAAALKATFGPALTIRGGNIGWSPPESPMISVTNAMERPECAGVAVESNVSARVHAVGVAAARL
jgi:hypothetical protein